MSTALRPSTAHPRPSTVHPRCCVRPRAHSGGKTPGKSFSESRASSRWASPCSAGPVNPPRPHGITFWGWAESRARPTSHRGLWPCPVPWAPGWSSLARGEEVKTGKGPGGSLQSFPPASHHFAESFSQAPPRSWARNGSHPLPPPRGLPVGALPRFHPFQGRGLLVKGKLLLSPLCFPRGPRSRGRGTSCPRKINKTFRIP